MSENDINERGPSAFPQTDKLSDTATSLKGEKATTAIKSRARKAAQGAQKAISKTAEQLNGGIEAANDKTSAVLDRASKGAQKLADRVDPFVTERPYASLGIGMAIGVVLGLLMAGRGPKIIYVKPRD